MSYGASQIDVLPGLQAIRRRPSMYIGSTGPAGVMQLLVELVQNAIDEALAGAASRIRVTLGEAIVVEDDGRGIPTEPHPQHGGRSALELVLCEVHAGGKFRAGAYQAAGGLHGVGLSAVNALSEQLQIEVRRGGRATRMACVRGNVVVPPTDVGLAEGTGTAIAFVPDPMIFTEGATLDAAAVARHLHEQAFLHAGLELELEHDDGREEHFESRDGLAGFARWVATTSGSALGVEAAPVHAAPIVLRGEEDGITVEAALLWTTGFGEVVRSFVNRVPTPKGGAHVDGLGAALLRSLRAHVRDDDADLLGSDLREGLVSILTVRMREPEFEGQTKILLTSPVESVVERIVARALGEALAADPESTRRIVGRIVESGRARLAARRAGERARYRTLDSVVSKELYKQQFGIRSKNWHDSCRWLTDGGLLGQHAAACAVGPEAEVLDICCGSGVVGNSFRGRVGKITGLDLTPEMIALARTRLDEVVQGDVYDIPFPEGRFDLVCNREVLHLLPDPDRPVSEVFRVLKPGGQFIVGQLVPFGTADAAWFFRVIKKKQPLFFNHLLDVDMHDMLARNGFVDITMTEYTHEEDIETWITTHETPNEMRHEIRDLYHHAPAEVRAVHPFRIDSDGRIWDTWRWVVFSCFKPSTGSLA